METTYKILGADGKQYGPVTFEQLQAWIKEGRIAADTQLLRSDVGQWRQASSYTELALPAASSPVPTAAPIPVPVEVSGGAVVSPERFEIEKRVKSGGSWYFWIAGLSMVNSVIAFSGGGGGFVIGLSITQVIDAALAGKGGNARLLGLLLGLLAAGIFALFGFFACKRQVWAFMAGMALYVLDTLLAVIAEQWLGVAFHAWVLFSLFIGMRAAMQARSLSE